MATKKNSQKTQQKVTRTKRVVSQTKVAKEKVNRQMRVTIYFGYGLFALTFIALCLSIVPLMLRLYPAPHLQDSRLTLVFFTFAFTALAPSLVGYMAGDSATRGKSKLTHHYNGVLFGVLGMWIWLCISLLSTILQSAFIIAVETNIQSALLQMAPAMTAAAVTIILAIFYARATRHKVSLIDYKPYRCALVVSAIALVVALATSSVSGVYYGSGAVMTLLINLIMPLLVLLVAGLLGYWIVGKKVGTPGERIVYVLVAITYSAVLGTVFAQFSFSFIKVGQEALVYEFVGIILAWVGYLVLLRRASR